MTHIRITTQTNEQEQQQQKLQNLLELSDVTCVEGRGHKHGSTVWGAWSVA